VAQMEGVLKSPGEFWTALENHLKPSLSYTVLLGRNRQPRPTDAPPVLSTGIHLRLPEATAEAGFRLGAIFSIPDGARVDGVTVRVEGQPIQAVTDEDGWFRLEKLKPGRYLLVAEIGGQTYRRLVVVRGAGTGSRPDSYRDVVLDQDRQPLAGVRVSVEGTDLHTVTNADGGFGFDLAPGRYTLRLQLDDWVQRRQILVRNSAYILTLGYGGMPLPGDEAANS